MLTSSLIKIDYRLSGPTVLDGYRFKW